MYVMYQNWNKINYLSRHTPSDKIEELGERKRKERKKRDNKKEKRRKERRKQGRMNE